MQQSIRNQAKLQRGMTFWSTLVVIAALVLLGTVGLKVLPAYLEFNAVRTAVKKIGRDSTGDLTKKAVAEEFDKQASVDNIDSIKGMDLQVNGNTVTAEYQKVVPLFANMSILLDFNVSSSSSK
ncbi:MAG TPA: DUF4845 domain-containing protein [Methylophilaceae bacterium]|nr:DUF4845 domain-containing protein [Methylophilaceae bacterium]